MQLLFLALPQINAVNSTSEISAVELFCCIYCTNNQLTGRCKLCIIKGHYGYSVTLQALCWQFKRNWNILVIIDFLGYILPSIDAGDMLAVSQENAEHIRSFICSCSENSRIPKNRGFESNWYFHIISGQKSCADTLTAFENDRINKGFIVHQPIKFTVLVRKQVLAVKGRRKINHGVTYVKFLSAAVFMKKWYILLLSDCYGKVLIHTAVYSACSKISGSVGGFYHIQKHITRIKKEPFVNKPYILACVVILRITFPAEL